MKTTEFIEKVQQLKYGYKVDIDGGMLIIHSIYKSYLTKPLKAGYISMQLVGELDVRSNDIDFIKLCVEYAETPLDKRNENKNKVKAKQIIGLCKDTITAKDKKDNLDEAIKLLDDLINDNYRGMRININTIKPNYYKNNGCYDDLIEEWHDTMPMDCFSAMMFANINKYLIRFKGKNGLQDLLKAKEYLKRWTEYAKADD